VAPGRGRRHLLLPVIAILRVVLPVLDAVGRGAAAPTEVAVQRFVAKLLRVDLDDLE
jgi:hypothetical protein